MVYNPQPPYNILRTDRVDFDTMQQMNRFARYWEHDQPIRGVLSIPCRYCWVMEPFARFWKLSEWIYAEVQQTHKIALPRLFVLVHEGGQAALGIERDRTGSRFVARLCADRAEGADSVFDGSAQEFAHPTVGGE